MHQITSFVRLCLFGPHALSADGAPVILWLPKGKGFASNSLEMHDAESSINTLSLALCAREVNRELRVLQGLKYTSHNSLSANSGLAAVQELIWSQCLQIAPFNVHASQSSRTKRGAVNLKRQQREILSLWTVRPHPRDPSSGFMSLVPVVRWKR